MTPPKRPSSRATPSLYCIRCVTIDGIMRKRNLQWCDAIFLDVEGYELRAIQGAAETIKRFRPVLVLEENICCRRYGFDQGDLGAYLARHFGYRLAHTFQSRKPPPQAKFPGADLIFVP
jgi:hypothetical protein